MTDSEIKKKKRADMRTALRNFPADYYRIAGERAAGHLVLAPCFARAVSVYLFCSMEQEIDTSFIFSACRASGKRIAVPRITADNHMEFVRCPERGADWRLSPYGIREPVPALPAEPLDSVLLPLLILVPGLAFTADGRRLGQGGGYYDRFLADVRKTLLPESVTVCGLCTGLQLADSLPVEKHDVRVEYILTDKAFVSAGKIVEEKNK